MNNISIKIKVMLELFVAIDSEILNALKNFSRVNINRCRVQKKSDFYNIYIFLNKRNNYVIYKINYASKVVPR